MVVPPGGSRCGDFRVKKNNFLSSFIILLANALFLSNAQACFGRISSEDVIYQLYKDFGWVSMFSSADVAAHHLGNPITEQPRSVISQYFDEKLTRLLINEANCIVKNKRGSL